MRITKVLFAAVAAGILATPAFAHAQGSQPTVPPTKAEKKAEKMAEKMAERKTDMNDEHAEHKAFEKGMSSPKGWLKGVKLTKAERTQVNTIEKKYNAQIASMKKDHLVAEKAGKEDDSQLVAKVQAVVDQEKTELRGVLTADQQARFDSNVAKRAK